MLYSIIKENKREIIMTEQEKQLMEKEREGQTKQTVQAAPIPKTGGLYTATKVFLILACIARGFAIIPLAWCIPMTVSIFHSFRDGRKVSMGMKICTLLFVSIIAGILLLCIPDDEDKEC